ncbi:MAG: glycerol kinase GlpK [Planctomycetota bacterium]
MTARHILALDQGTTSSRAIVFDETGAVRGKWQREFRQHFPQSGWVEHDASEIWRTQLEAARQALRAAKVQAGDLAAIGITNQRETTVVWERATGRPIANAIVWQDRRTAEVTERLRAQGAKAEVSRVTGMVLDPYFSATKIAWLLDHVPDARARAARGELAAGTIDSWLLWNLTGGAVHATDVTNASRTSLMDLRTGQWSDAMLKLFGVPREVLPEIRACDADFAATASGVLDAAVPVRALIGDQQAALFGQQCIRPGMAKCTFGTGCFLLMQVGDAPVASRNRLLSTPAWRRADESSFALEGSVFVGGSAIQWLRDGLGLIHSAPAVNELAAEVPDSGGVMVVPAFTGLGAPHWDPSARGVIVGISRGTTAAHLARATLEGIAHQVADLVEAMAADAGRSIDRLRVDGGAAASDLLMQMQADLLGVTVERPTALESTAMGAAFMAGLAVGAWNDLGQIEGLRSVDRSFEPRMERAERERLRARWRDAVGRAKGWERGTSAS